MATQKVCTTEQVAPPAENPQAAEADSQLGSLLKHPAIWRARDRHTRPANGQSSGFAELDAQLPEQGWPRAGLIEILSDRHGIGELQLIMPLLTRLSQQDSRWISWVNPPFIPYAPALFSQQVQLEKVLWVRARDPRETLWATHQSLSTGSCSMVLSWTDKDILAGESRRLQVSASDSDTLSILFRPLAASRQPSSAVLRLSLQAGRNGLRVETLKSRGGWPAQPVQVPLKEAPGFETARLAGAPAIFPNLQNQQPRVQTGLFNRPQSQTPAQAQATVHVPSLPSQSTPMTMTGKSSPGSAPGAGLF